MAGSAAVLLIDDNGDDAFLFQRAMGGSRAQVRLHVVTDVSSAQNYLRGLEPYEDRSKWPMPRLVFLDMRLRQTHGTEFLTWAKANPRFKRIPIVAVSSSLTGVAANEILSLGANAVMVKAAQFNELKDAIVSACDLWLHYCVGPDFGSEVSLGPRPAP
jgi:CheY-like chemotaxis protein